MVIQRVASPPPHAYPPYPHPSYPSPPLSPAPSSVSHSLTKDVLYIGSAVPLETSEGLEAIQQPLRSRYPVHDEESIQGILSTLTVTQNGIQLRYKTDPSHVVFFPYSALSLCAAVRCVKSTNAATSEVTSRFVSLTKAPQDGLGGVSTDRPSIFTTITRRTKGRQVLECHGFITVTPRDALDLVQWTSTRHAKYRQVNGGADAVNDGFTQMNGGAHTASTTGLNTTAQHHDVFRADASFRAAETGSLPDYPVNIVPGEPMVHTAAPAFYNESPKEGYFYSTKKAQAKKYSLHKFTQSAAEDDYHQIHQEGGKSAYAGSHFSLPVSHHPPPSMLVPGPVGPVPMRPGPMMRPVLVHGPPPPPHMGYARPRFFSPPPPPPAAYMRPQPVPVFLPPPPPGYIMPNNNGVPSRSKSRGRGYSTDSSSSTSSTSPGRGKRTSKKHHNQRHAHAHHVHHAHHHHHHNHEDSSITSSRPVTPPTDYESAPPAAGGRISRKDEYHLRQSFLRELNGAHHPQGAMTMWPPNRKPHPHGYYMVPMPGYPGAPTLPRARSVPPPGEKSSKKEKKSKKKKNKKSSKKDDHRSSKKNGAAVITDGGNLEGTAEIEGDAAMRQRDAFIMDNHQNIPMQTLQHEQSLGYEKSFSKSAAERAFSKSLAAETRNTTHRDAFNAYLINQNGVPEGEFPALY